MSLSLRKRGYEDACGVARALGAVGERWALLVVRELLFGPKRFSDLVRGLPSMSQNVLSQRLRELEAAGIVSRRRLGPPVSGMVYELTQLGRQLEPVLVTLGRWGSQLPFPDSGELSTDALMLALKTTFNPRRARGLRGQFELRVGDDTFVATVGAGKFFVQRGAAVHPLVTFSADGATLRALAFGRLPMDDALRSTALALDGDRRAAERFFHAFSVSAAGGRRAAS